MSSAWRPRSLGVDPASGKEAFVVVAEASKKVERLGQGFRLPVEVVRFGSRLVVKKSIAPDTLDVVVPSLLLQPLVENAVKHGIASQPEGGLVELLLGPLLGLDLALELQLAIESGGLLAELQPTGQPITGREPLWQIRRVAAQRAAQARRCSPRRGGRTKPGS